MDENIPKLKGNEIINNFRKYKFKSINKQLKINTELKDENNIIDHLSDNNVNKENEKLVNNINPKSISDENI